MKINQVFNAILDHLEHKYLWLLNVNLGSIKCVHFY